MIIGERLVARLSALTMSQSELARRVGLSQATIWKLISGASRGSTHIVRIARELGTTPAYLEGETDDPDENAPPPPAPPQVQFVTLQVALPREDALARMFEGLLRVMPEGASLAEQAQLLAQRLPIGLSKLQDLLPPAPIARGDAVPELARSDATRAPAHQP